MAPQYFLRRQEKPAIVPKEHKPEYPVEEGSVRKAKALLAATAIAAFSVLPTGTALAGHNCRIDSSDELDTICDNYHDPKPLLSYLVCFVSPSC